ncbi:MAG TPA: nucleotidyltransferase domain-containing protein [Xanthomonadaceae bacterium]|nr:nucleotidyltransferase domain-containing protein [Xanthomonadaceae bacterium]
MIARVPNSGMIVPAMGTSVLKGRSGAGAGRSEPAATGLADVLFTPVQQRVLGLLFGQPERRYQSAELIRLARSGTGSVHRLMTRLARAGLVETEVVGNQKFYQANADSPIFAELCGLVRKTFGLAGPLQAALAPLADRITAAFVYGSIAKGADRADSDIDLLVIADDLDYAALYSALPEAEAALSRPVNPNVMTLAEWRRKRQQAGSFVARIAAQPKQFVIGSEHELE